MRGSRLLVATRKAERVFEKYHGFSPRNEKVASAYYYDYQGRKITRWTLREIRRLIGFYRKTKVPCSCWMCCNRRRQGEIPINELKAKEDFENQVIDLDKPA